MNTNTKIPQWLAELRADVQEASKAFENDNWPDAWLYIGSTPWGGSDTADWYDWSDPLLGLPVYHTPARIKHSGYDGEQQRIIPLWFGDVSNKAKTMREFELRLAKSGDF